MREKRVKNQVAKPVKTESKAKSGKTINPSEKLATLLRREAQMAVRVRAMQESLREIRTEIAALWTERERQAAELLDQG